MKRLTVAISPFANSINSGHSLIDDEFYFEYLVNKNVDFIFYTSKISADRILLKFKGKDSCLRVVDNLFEQMPGVTPKVILLLSEK